ncbi:glycosyltransferase [Lutispora thermophila]|uniref:Glycosyltransferases, probably involved in cell wall biogenesis n=1 Tax=Lutispora thermophila DSM 19022 TaxID=1122184 RepID=A0A1M6AQG2_9FIRM|nr:glycosyltransferase [Lutispora thermophila]SHI38730.1 Glycosyltransferases, probably involved in cell wall biogenesis [Lutispora thermophila DSM 19022]
MNNNKICFISCVNNQQLYREALYYINQLEIPEGYEVECISVENAESMARGYYEAMKASDAKYKVYLHQDVYIINRSFIKDILNIFKSNEKIGMLGVVGAKVIPTNGVWWESKNKYGKVYDNHAGKVSLLSFEEVKNAYETVQAIDGLTMITQYDIPWRQDIFDGWHFYDLSQSIEFIKAGYDVAIPNQVSPWVIHDCGIVNVKNRYEDYRKLFLEEYSKDIFPLVSILIPTYNRPEYFRLALESALNQTYKNIEIIVGDDSTNDETECLMKNNYLNKYSNIKYYHNEKNLGQFDNDIKLYEMAQGEYINFLMDDDLFEETKIEKMMNYFIFDDKQEITLVTSHRAVIDGNGEIKEIFRGTDRIFDEDKVIDGIELGDFILMNIYNCIGEPTTALFRKDKLMEPFGVFNGRKYGCNVDQASWLNLLSMGKAVYINEVLSYFRVHEGQQQHNLGILLKGYTDYIHQVITGREKGFLSDDDKYIYTVRKFIKYGEENIIKPLDEAGFKSEEYENFKKYYDWLKEENNKIGILHKDNNDLPLVSILIPAYNQTKYLKEALESAINQTYPNIEIIIGDDSTTNEVEEFIKPYLNKYSNIIYFKNKKEKMDYGMTNVNELLNRSKGEYVNYLYHDDIFHVTKIEKMMRYFLSRDDVSLVTSHRQLIDENGEYLPDDNSTRRIVDKDSIINGNELCLLCLDKLINFIGEPTTVLFKKSLLEDGFGYYNNNYYMNIADMVTWFSLLEKGKVAYMCESLSFFRQHSNQNSQNLEVFYTGINEWKKIIDDSYDTGLIDSKMAYINYITKWFYSYNVILKDIPHQKIDSSLKKSLVDSFKNAIDIIAEEAKHKHECVICGNQVERFLPYSVKMPKSIEKYRIVGSDVRNFSCPYCYSHDRERHLKMYFDRLKLWGKITGSRVLHIAPEANLRKIIKSYKPKEYICGDLYPMDSEIIKMDITKIHFENEYFDFIICNHVLEHIEDDMKAMMELFRVLKKDGYAVLQTPYSPVLEKSYEDYSIQSKEKRLENYGQEDHVRIYGLDFFKRLEDAGFSLNIINNNELFSEEESKRYGVNSYEDLILVHKQ